MRLPVIQGVIRRRILVNFAVDPEVMQRQIPSRFRPKLHDGQAVAGVCLIRLEHIRPKMLPEIVGLSSENAAHRVAVEWEDEQGASCEGVFVPRRDTDSEFNHLLGGRVFPGEYNRAEFKVVDASDRIDFSMRAEDGSVSIELTGLAAEGLPASSIFSSLAESSSFFERGSLGYSATSDQDRLDGIRLDTMEWRVEPLDVENIYSSYFADGSRFPTGSVQFDHALIMRNVQHEWHSAANLYL